MPPLNHFSKRRLKSFFRGHYGSAPEEIGVVMERYVDEEGQFTGPVLARFQQQIRLYAVPLTYLQVDRFVLRRKMY